ncbi:hypothetical protein RQP46_006589 [Phenoliferia psychrophenolica]
MAGGSGLASSTSWWHQGAKTWQAPSPQERRLEIEKRRLHELEERKVKMIKEQAHDLRENTRLANKVARANNLAVRAEIGAEVGALRRSRSAGNLGLVRERQALAHDRAAVHAIGHQQAELNHLRRERQGLEVAAAHRARTNSMLRSQQAQMAAANAAAIRSPYRMPMHSTQMHMGAEQARMAAANAAVYGGGLGAGLGASPMMGRRMRSHSVGAVPGGLGYVSPHMGGIRTPHMSPHMGVMHSPHSPAHVGYRPPSPMGRPIINNYNFAPPSPGRNHLGAGLSGPVGAYGLSPRTVVVNNIPSPHHSPLLNGYGASPHRSPYANGGLGGLDDVVGMRGRPMVDPVLVDGGGMGMGMGGQQPLFNNGYRGASPGRMRAPSPGGMGMGMRGHSPRQMPRQVEEFVLTDEAFRPPYQVLQELGAVESFATIIPGVMELEDEVIQSAVDQLVGYANSTASEAESAVPAFNPDDFLARAERRAKERLEAATLAHAAKRAEEEKERAAIARKELYDEERDEFFLPDPIDVVAPPPPPPSVAHAIFDANGQIQDDENEREFAESTRILDARGEEIRRQMAELAEEEAALSQLVEADAALRKELERRLELASRARLVLSSLLEMMVNGTEDPELESAPHHHLLAVDEKSSAPPQTSASRSFAAP